MDTPKPLSILLNSTGFGLLARALLTLPFWWSGLSKLSNLPGAMAEAQHFGLRPAGLVVAATILVQLGASLLLILKRLGWLAAGALGVFTALATGIAHPYWTVADPIERFHALNTFLEHLGLIGGLMIAAVMVEKARKA